MPANSYYLGQAGKSDRDDRPADNISFAATNLVKPNIQSRRQQSEPPVGRNVFPPTPPPENDRPGMSRGASVRNGGPKPMPARLDINKARPGERFEKSGSSPQDRPRPSRAASATPQRGYSQRSGPGGGNRRSAEDDEYPDDVYDMYGGGNGGAGGRGSRQQGRRPNNPRYVEEEPEDEDDYDDGSFDEGDFEMVSNNRRGTGSVAGSSSGRGASRRPDVRKIRIKVHAEDVRYIMIGSAVEFPDLVDKIRDKFGIRRRFKIKVKDDDGSNGDMITMGDQDDLDMILMNAKSQARRQRQDVGKMEVSILTFSPLSGIWVANLFSDLGSRSLEFIPRGISLLYSGSTAIMKSKKQTYLLLFIHLGILRDYTASPSFSLHVRS